MTILADGNVGIGTETPVARLELRSTTGQQRWSYDASTRLGLTVGAGGTATFDADGTTPRIAFSDGLTLPAGTATAGTSPLKFTSGTNLTTKENGAVEYDGSVLTYTANSVRYNTGTLSGTVSTTGTATTTFTVTIGQTQPNTTYKPFITASNALSATMFYISNKTTTTFDVVFVTGLTGAVAFDWMLTP